MLGNSKRFVVLALVLTVVGTTSLLAWWQKDGVRISSQPGTNYLLDMISDGQFGAILAWENEATPGVSFFDIYAQGVDFWGNTLWTAGDVAICTAANNQFMPHMVTDGAGGAIISWDDERNLGTTMTDIYCQRVDAAGTARWTANGVVVCNAGDMQGENRITTDGAGGAIIVWSDYRSTTNNDVYAQRINNLGVTQWGINGVAVCTGGTESFLADLDTDMQGGAIIAWMDDRFGNFDIYAQRLDAFGAAQWAVNGIPVCVAAATQETPMVISDGAGGAVIAWSDTRSGNFDVYAQRVDALGTMLWVPNGVAVCADTYYQSEVQIAPDGNGGAVFVWTDSRGPNRDVYAQYVDATGVPQWAPNGVAVCTAANDQDRPQIVATTAGDWIFAWNDQRTGQDVYAQAIDATGAPLWTADGVPVCEATGPQQDALVATDGVGGALVAWTDARTFPDDIRGQRIGTNGRWGFTPEITEVKDVPKDQGGKVTVTWDATDIDNSSVQQITHYSIWRSLSAQQSAALLAEGHESADPSDIIRLAGGPAYRFFSVGAATYGWEWLANMSAHFLPTYTYTAATLYDSIGTDTGYHHFFVSAHVSNPFGFWDSDPDSGYSVDNFSPGVPQSLAGYQEVSPDGLRLVWDHNTEADLWHYAVYRGTSEGFVPGPGNLIASPTDTTSFDGSWVWDSGYYYKVSAIDIHGNESPFALLRPENITGTDSTPPLADFLDQNYPNPFNPATKIVFGLKEASHTSLEIYDATGRLVRVLADERLEANRYERTWDGTDNAGRSVASGVYFYKLVTKDFTQTRKMVLLK